MCWDESKAGRIIIQPASGSATKRGGSMGSAERDEEQREIRGSLDDAGWQSLPRQRTLLQHTPHLRNRHTHHHRWHLRRVPVQDPGRGKILSDQLPIRQIKPRTNRNRVTAQNVPWKELPAIPQRVQSPPPERTCRNVRRPSPQPGYRRQSHEPRPTTRRDRQAARIHQRGSLLRILRPKERSQRQCLLQLRSKSLGRTRSKKTRETPRKVSRVSTIVVSAMRLVIFGPVCRHLGRLPPALVGPSDTLLVDLVMGTS